MTGSTSLEQLSNPSKARDVLLSTVKKGSLVGLLQYIQEHPQVWSILASHAGAMIEALVERTSISPQMPACRQLLAGLPVSKIMGKAQDMLHRGQLEWASALLDIGCQMEPDLIDWYQIRAEIFRRQQVPESEREALLELAQYQVDGAARIGIARRLTELDAWLPASEILILLYRTGEQHDGVLDTLAEIFLAHQYDREIEVWDEAWAPLLDAGERTTLWSLILSKSKSQTMYDWQALTDGIGAMDQCLACIEGRDLEKDSQSARHGHELALGLMRLVKGTQPLEKSPQQAKVLVLDLLFALENRWRESGLQVTRELEVQDGTVWMDEQVFLSALELMCQQYIERFSPPAHIHCRAYSQGSNAIVIRLCGSNDDGPAQQQELSTIDQAFIQRVMQGHGVRRMEAEDSALTIMIPIGAHHRATDGSDEQQARQWLTQWLAKNGNAMAAMPIPPQALFAPFQYARLLVRELQEILVSEWAEQIRIIVHDLKNGFTFMQQWINQALADPYSWNMAVERVQQNKQRMASILADLRQWVALSGVPSLSRLTLIDVVRKVVEDTRAFLEHHGVRCIISERGQTNPIFADRERLSSALFNLVKNGVEAMPQGGILAITVEMTDDARVLLKVEDTGTGIPTDELPELFATGRTTKSGGTGVGLAAVERAVRSMGATISVASSVGRGTCFTIEFAPSKKPSEAKLVERLAEYPAQVQQALRASHALMSTGDYATAVHLWVRGVGSQLDAVLKTGLAPYRVKALLLGLCDGGKRHHFQLRDSALQKLARLLPLTERQIAKRSDTVVAALSSGDWSKLNHELHWAILLRLFDVSHPDVYPLEMASRKKISLWLCECAEAIQDGEFPPDTVRKLGDQLGVILELTLYPITKA